MILNFNFKQYPVLLDGITYYISGEGTAEVDYVEGTLYQDKGDSLSPSCITWDIYDVSAYAKTVDIDEIQDSSNKLVEIESPTDDIVIKLVDAALKQLILTVNNFDEQELAEILLNRE